MESTIEIIRLETKHYCLIFHPDVVKSPLDGHTWSFLVKAYCHTENISIENVIHDPESDQYCAIASEVEPLREIAAVIETLTSNSDLCDKYIAIVSEQDRSQDDEDMSTEEFLEWMVEAGYDMTVPKTFSFDLDNVTDVKQARTIQNEIEKKGYKSTIEVLDNEVYFEIKVKIRPSLKLVLEVESFLESIASEFGVEYIGFGINL